MANFSIRINLKKLNQAGLVNIKGKDGRTRRCIVIPTDVNREIFVGEKNIYFNLSAFETKEVSQFGDTHMLKGNLDKEAFEALSEEERRNLPILGNMKPLERKVQEMQAASIPDSAVSIADEEDDLPF
jgi:DNA-binding MarR family transcriptional regulator